jgi:trehalose 6-phosphate phosphatase
MENLLYAWPKLVEKIHRADKILFLSDFDGTLAAIVEKPELAVMSDETRILLKALTREHRFTVGIISGRALNDLKSKVDISGIIYAGNHGFEIEGPGINFVNPLVDEIKPFFRILLQILMLSLGSIKGVFIEDKGITLSVHYRQAEDDKVCEIEKVMKKVIDRPVSRGLFNITTGKEVYEVRPAINWDKGKAIRLLMKRHGKGGRRSGLLVIYLGDDRTDEDGFKVIEKYGNGISVIVSENNTNTSANYRLSSTDEVRCFLVKLLDNAQKDKLCEQYLPDNLSASQDLSAGIINSNLAKLPN